jgi:hypothetical protein
LKILSYIYKNKITIIGALLLCLGFFILKYDSLDIYIRPFTQIFLMGSSKGKDVLFFVLMGSMMFLSPLFISDGYIRNKLNYFKDFEDWRGNDFLKRAIILVILTYILGIILEIWVRAYFNVSIFTTFVSLVPNPTSSSILHSHIFKSVLGPFISSIVTVPSGVHVGTSLLNYVPSLGLLIIIIFPLVYIMGLFSIGERREYHRAIIIFSISTTLIGLIDGGLLSTPALVGLSGIIGMYSLKMPFSFKNLINPSLVIAFLIIFRVVLGILGSNTDYYEITVIGSSENIDLNDYSVISIEKQDGKIIFHISNQYNEMVLLNDLSKYLEGKSDGFFISGNFFSYFSSSNT